MLGRKEPSLVDRWDKTWECDWLSTAQWKVRTWISYISFVSGQSISLAVLYCTCSKLHWQFTLKEGNLEGCEERHR